VPGETDSIMVDELPWDGRFVKRAPNTTHSRRDHSSTPTYVPRLGNR